MVKGAFGSSMTGVVQTYEPKKYGKVYYKQNRENVRAYQKRYYQMNKNRLKMCANDYYHRLDEEGDNYYFRNKERLLKKMAEYRLKNKKDTLLQ